MWNTITTKIAAFGAAILAIMLAIAAIFRKGEQVEKAKEQQEQAEATEKAKVIREKIDEQVSKIPEAPTQTIGTASPDSAAGRLSTWTRD